MPENQEIKTPIESNKEVTTSKEQTTPDSFSSVKNNPLFQAQLNTYKTEHPEIEKNINEYLQKNTQKTEGINKLLNNPNLDDAKKTKIINTIIDASIKEIAVFSNIETKNNQNHQEIDSKKVEQKQVVNSEEQKKVEQKETTKETINKMIEEIDGKFENLLKDPKNQNLATELNSDNYKNNYKEVAEDFKNTAKDLRSKGVSDENIDKLIKFRTAEKIISSKPELQNEQTKDFFIAFKKLENELNIPDTKIQDLSPKNVEQISSQIFNTDTGNQNLIKTIAENKQAHAEDFEKLFDAPKDIKELNDMYGKFLPDKQNTYNAIADKQQSQSQLTQTEQDFLNRFKTELEAKKTEFETSTSDTMEQSTILGPIMGLANYMDMGIGNTFEFNKSNDIQIDNGMLSITGNIDNKPFTLETNLDKPSKLKTSDYVNKSDDSNMGVANQNRQETAYIMPGHKEIRENIKENFGKTHQDILKDATSINEYQETLKKTLCENVQKLYGFKDLVQIRIEKQMTKNIAAQETLDMLNTTILNGKYDYDKSINKNLHPELHNFLSDLDYSLENLSSDEIDSRRQNIQELGKVLDSNQEGKQKNSCKILQDLSPSLLKETGDIIERKPSTEGQGNTSLFTFFECLKDSQSKTYRVDEFKKLLDENHNPKPNDQNYKNILENRNTKTADDNLDLSLFISIEQTTTIEYSIS